MGACVPAGREVPVFTDAGAERRGAVAFGCAGEKSGVMIVFVLPREVVGVPGALRGEGVGSMTTVTLAALFLLE